MMSLFYDVCCIDSHRLIACWVRVEPVVAGVFPLHPSVIIRVLQELGKVENAVYVPCLTANPVVYIESGSLVEVGIISCALEWGDSAEINFHLPGFCLLHHSLYALNNLACHRFAASASGCTDVVDAFKDNHLLHAVLHQDIPVEALLGEGTEATRNGYAVVADAQVQHTLIGYLMLQLQHLRHHVGPSVLGIVGRAFSVGDGVSDDGDGAHVVAHRIDIDAADVVPMVFSESLHKVGVGIGYSLHDVGGGAGTHVNGRHFGSRGIVDGDGYPFQISEIELQGIAHYLLAGRDDCLVAVAELEVLCRLGIDGKGILGMSDVDGADFHGLHRIDVTQLEADYVASYANLYHLANRTVSHAIVIGHK